MPRTQLEALLLTQPQIADATVIGARMDDGEEVQKAFVVRQAGAGDGDEDIMAKPLKWSHHYAWLCVAGGTRRLPYLSIRCHRRCTPAKAVTTDWMTTRYMSCRYTNC